MTATVSVSLKSALKDSKDAKDRIKDRKETKEGKDGKELSKDRKDQKDRIKERKDGKEFKEFFKEISKERKDLKDRVEFKVFDRPGGGFSGPAEPSAAPDVSQVVAELDARVTALEAALGATGEHEPFISGELRPDLVGGPDYTQQGNLQERMASGDRDAKIAFDNLPPK
jgi:immune inhibitor A